MIGKRLAWATCIIGSCPPPGQTGGPAEWRGFWRDSFGDLFSIEIEVIRIDVNQNGRALDEQSTRGGDKRERRGDDFVPGPIPRPSVPREEHRFLSAATRSHI